MFINYDYIATKTFVFDMVISRLDVFFKYKKFEKNILFEFCKMGCMTLHFFVTTENKYFHSV